MTKEELFLKFQPNDFQEKLYFWGHTPKGDGTHDETCLSQWYGCEFRTLQRQETFYSAEQFMMYCKAVLFNDHSMAENIICQRCPRICKRLGRQIRNFDEVQWDTHKIDVVIRANVLKFSQSHSLMEFLESTKGKYLIEASPYDRVWGIGMIKESAMRVSPSQWKGENLLGLCLMEVREYLF